MNLIKQDDGTVTTVLDVFKSTSQAQFFTKLLVHCDQTDLIWYSNKETIGKIAKEMSLSDVRIKQLLKDLCDSGILIKRTRGVYIISKKYVTNQSSK